MAYSIGNKELPVLQDNSSSTIGAMGEAFKTINGSFDKLANLPWLGRRLVQENADARYSAALNKYSNDPDGLAKALNNGDIDTTDVSANTLNQTQERLQAIGNNYTRNYLQGRAEATNNYFDKNGAIYQGAVNEAQTGHPEKLAQIRANLGEVPWEVGQQYSLLNAQSQKNEDAKLALERANLGYIQNKDAMALKAREAFFHLRRNLAPYLQDPDSIAAVKADMLAKGVVDPLGRNISVANDLSSILADPTVSKEFDNFINYWSPETLSSNVAPRTEQSTPNANYTLGTQKRW